MDANKKFDYSSKVITVEKALSFVKSGDHIITGFGAADAQAFMSKLHTIADRVTDVHVTNCSPLVDSEFYSNPIYKDNFKVDAWFYTAGLRKAHRHGAVSFIPNFLHFAGSRRLEHIHPNIFIALGSMPDKHGFVSLSLSNVYEQEVIEKADIVILEINPNAPRTQGDLNVHLSNIDYVIEVNYPIPEVPEIPSNEKDEAIGKYISSLIKDGDCLQLGIGGIPNAVGKSLYGKKDLGIHTEMLTTEMAKLAKAGVITGKNKQIARGKIIGCFAMGTRELYDFIDDNPMVEIRAGSWVNDPQVIQQNDNQISINTTLEVDLVGQCASESLGSMQFSGAGGQTDTSVGAQRSKNGRSVIALYSTAMAKNPVTGEREEVSKIVCQLKPGAAVTLSRADVHYVVTEFGMVNLRGTTIRERVDLLISIAHPNFREALRKEAIELGIIYE